MKLPTIIGVLLSIVSILRADTAILLNIEEFAHFPEIKASNSQQIKINIYNTFGSHFPVKEMNKSKDGTDSFPSLKNVQRALKSTSTKTFTYISSHLKNSGEKLLIALPESQPANSSNFLTVKDFGINPSIIVIQTPTNLTDDISSAFHESFKNFNGAAFLMNQNEDPSFALSLFKKDMKLWRTPLLEKLGKGNKYIAGRIVKIGSEEIQQVKKECDLARNQAEKTGAPEFASELFTAAIIKYRISSTAKLTNPVKNYFTWKQTIDAFKKCEAIALSSKYKNLSENLRSQKLEVYGHPQWEDLLKSLSKAKTSYSENNFKNSAQMYEKASSILTQVHKDIVSNLELTIKETSDKNSQKGLIRSLIQLAPSKYMNYGYVGFKFTNSKSIDMNYIPAGKFIMGSPESESGREWDENQREVTISNSFYMSSTEISEDQFRQVMGMSYKPEQGIHANDTNLKRIANHPIRLSWQEAVKFCKELSKQEGKKYRLPTEAEWEYACRAGSKNAFNTGSTISSGQANTKEANQSIPEKCGSKPANAWGLHDMHGNVWEWCSDWSFMYDSKEIIDPKGPTQKFAEENELDMKVVRGGSFDDPAIKARAANRWEYSPSVTSNSIGFRIVLELQK